MSTWGERLHEDVEALRQRRDELRVQLDLGKREAADAWHDLEDRWQQLEAKLKVLGPASKEAAGDIVKATGKLVDEIREALAKVARQI